MTNAQHYLTLSYATLDKHVRNGAFDAIAALRLLRRNARDIAPYAPHMEHMRIARQLFDSWRNSATYGALITTDSE